MRSPKIIMPRAPRRKSIARILFWANIRAALGAPFRAIGRIFHPVHSCCKARRSGPHRFGCSVGGAQQIRFNAEFKRRGDRRILDTGLGEIEQCDVEVVREDEETEESGRLTVSFR